MSSSVAKFPLSKSRKLDVLRDRNPPVSTITISEIHEILAGTERFQMILDIWKNHRHSSLILIKGPDGLPQLRLTFHKRGPRQKV